MTCAVCGLRGALDLATVLDGEEWTTLPATVAADLVVAGLLEFLREPEPDEDASGSVYVLAPGTTWGEVEATIRRREEGLA